eukprot:1162100-Pelagomonas_calceolata.AAC.12
MRSTGVEGAQEYRNEYPWQDFYENMPKVIVSGIAPPGVFAHRLTELEQGVPGENRQNGFHISREQYKGCTTSHLSNCPDVVFTSSKEHFMLSSKHEYHVALAFF